MSDFNPYIVLISGKSGTGKSSSLANLKDPEKVLYLNCENGRALPFKSKFKEVTITHPEQVLVYLDKAKESDKFKTIIIDSITYLMDMYESKCVLTSSNTQKAWGDYGQYFKQITHKLAECNLNIIITGHTFSEFNEISGEYETKIPIKGALAKQGVESYFSVNISPKKEKLTKLEKYQSDLLTITEDDEELGYKHVLQVLVTKDTTGERIKTPMGLFGRNETFINSDVQLVLDRLHEFYN